jgi:hypothetical protein
MRNSDPYRSYGYESLHRDDGGNWGRHIWPALKQRLEDMGLLGELTIA